MTEATTIKGGTKVTVPKIYGAIAAIQAEVGSIPKNGIGPANQGSYKFISNDDIIANVSKLLAKYKVIVKTNTLDKEYITRDIGGGRIVNLSVFTVETTYISVEDGSEFAITTVGEGADNGDKGGRKAYTQASKVANMLTFVIATGEPDPDSVDAPSVTKQSAVANKITAAKGANATSLFNEIKVFLGANELTGAVANALGTRLSGGKTSAEWQTDIIILGEILKALKAGEVE